MTVHCHPRGIRRQAFRTTVIAVIGCGLALPASAGGDESVAATVRRQVRSHNATIVKIIEQASGQSETFRSLIGMINAGNGIVYVENGPCLGNMQACLVTVTPARANHRVLHVRVDVVKAGEDLVGSIGHELYHATEILGSPAVTSGDAMFSMYSRIGYAVPGGGFETSAAVKAGNAVRKEMRAASQKLEQTARRRSIRAGN